MSLYALPPYPAVRPSAVQPYPPYPAVRPPAVRSYPPYPAVRTAYTPPTETKGKPQHHGLTKQVRVGIAVAAGALGVGGLLLARNQLKSLWKAAKFLNHPASGTVLEFMHEIAQFLEAEKKV